MKKLIVKTESQTAELWDASKLIRSYKISTSANGLGCEVNSYCTPLGKLRVSEKIGEGLPIGTVFKARVPTGEVWTTALNENLCKEGDDLVLTRILWLDGDEEQNRNTRERYIYLHGTNHEDKLGQRVSHGCIRFSNHDILEIFEQLEVGAEVLVV